MSVDVSLKNQFNALYLPKWHFHVKNNEVIPCVGGDVGGSELLCRADGRVAGWHSGEHAYKP